MGIKARVVGNSKNLEKYLERISKVASSPKLLKKAGEKGVPRLKDSTPVDSGKSRDSWDYDITKEGRDTVLSFTNDNVTKNGAPVVVLIKNGHATGTHGYVPPNDFISPVLDDLVRDLSNDLDKEIRNG